MKPVLLVADGDSELCQIYERFLASRGFDVETAGDGLDCLVKLRRRCPTVVVLDLDICWGGGDGVLAWLREGMCSAWVPVVLTATAGSPQHFSESVEPPVVQCLQKPFTLAVLLEAVRGATANGSPMPRSGEPGFLCSEAFVG